MSTEGWVGEIVKWHGVLWDVTEASRAEDGTVWLVLADHYGTRVRASVLAEKVEVALQ